MSFRWGMEIEDGAVCFGSFCLLVTCILSRRGRDVLLSNAKLWREAAWV